MNVKRIHRVKHKSRDFTQLENCLLRNTTLSYRALGVLCESLSHSDEWEVTRDWLANRRKEGREAISAAMQELESQGYALFICERNETGKIVSVGWCFHEEPIPDDKGQRSNRTRWREEPTERLPVRSGLPSGRESHPDGKPASILKRPSDSKENQSKTNKVRVSVDELSEEEAASPLNTSSPSSPNSASPSSPSWVPEWDEIAEWADERKWPREKAAEFFNYYDAISWEVKGSKLKNWRAKAMSWFNRWREEKAQKAQPAGCKLG